MNERYETYDDDMEIDLIDFLFYLLRRWKSLVAMILLGVVLGSAFYVVKTTKSSNAVAEDYQPDADTEANMKLAAQYRRLYDQQIDYNEHSIIMQMDPNQVYEGTLTYYLAAGEQTELLGQLYTNVINDENVVAELKEAAGLTCDDQYVKELISCTTSKDIVNENSSLSGSVVNDIQVKVTGEQVSNVVITYQIAYLDKEICGKMIEVLKNAIESATQEYQSIYGDCKFELLQNTMLINVNGFYLEKQKTNIAYLDSYFAKAVELENKLNDEEKIYYQNVYSSSKYQIENTKDKNDMNNISIMTMIQWVIIGILMSIIFWILYFYLRYLADASVKTFRQVKHMNLPIIGLIENRNKKSNWIDNMERKRRIYDSIDYIVKSIGELTDEQILFCIDPSIESEKYFGGILEAKVKNIKMIRLFQMDIGNFELAKKSKGIIFCVCLKNTSIKQMEHELEMCNIHNIEVLGAVVID